MSESSRWLCRNRMLNQFRNSYNSMWRYLFNYWHRQINRNLRRRISLNVQRHDPFRYLKSYYFFITFIFLQIWSITLVHLAHLSCLGVQRLVWFFLCPLDANSIKFLILIFRHHTLLILSLLHRHLIFPLALQDAIDAPQDTDQEFSSWEEARIFCWLWVTTNYPCCLTFFVVHNIVLQCIILTQKKDR